jgi:putative oxidoreductase
MRGKLFSYTPLWRRQGLSVIRIITGFLLFYHGFEVFEAETMKTYLTWDSFKGYSSPELMVYMGKTAELVAGFLLGIGFITRLASIVVMGTMLYITFFVGHGKIWYDDQHPFLFVLLALVFFFNGPGRWSVAYLIFYKKRSGGNNHGTSRRNTD